MSSQIASRYARALFAVVPPQERVAAKDELKSIVAILQEPQIRSVFSYPRTPKERKAVLVNLINASAIIKQFLLLTIEKSRDALLPFIEREFEQLVLQAEKTTIAEVTSAVSLQPAMLARVQTQLEKLSQKTVILQNKVDPKIGGGLIIKIDGKVVDGSISNSLQRFQQSLTN